MARTDNLKEILTYTGITIHQDNNNNQKSKNERLVLSKNLLRTYILGVILKIMISTTYLLNINNGCSNNELYIS